MTLDDYIGKITHVEIATSRAQWRSRNYVKTTIIQRKYTLSCVDIILDNKTSEVLKDTERASEGLQRAILGFVRINKRKE